MSEEKKFTQEEVNKIVKERLERERTREKADNEGINALKGELEALKSELKETQEKYLKNANELKSTKLKNDLAITLDKSNVISNELIGLFIDKVDYNKDGDLIARVEGEEQPINEYMNNWIERNPWAVKDTQHAGSGGPNSTSSGKAERSSLRGIFGLDD